ncbi:unnamed protein product [Symbiodinium sp. CCMP2456]|nr:unnamed protein product [Symbiodinium sp. CCMP2456]
MATEKTKAMGVSEITTEAAFREAIAGHAVVLVYFSYGPRTAEVPFSLGDEFDPQFQEFGESEEVIPPLCRVTHADATRDIFASAGISSTDGGSLALYKEGTQLANVSLKALHESEELEEEIARWLSGSFPTEHQTPEATDAVPPQPQPAPTAASPVLGQTPGTTCGAAPKGPPPGPKGPPTSPVPGQTAGATCGAAPKGPPPGPKPPGQPTTTVTFGAALAGPPPGPKVAASPVPGQTAGATCGAAPKGPPPGPKPPGQPTTTITFGAALAGPPPAAESPLPGQKPPPVKAQQAQAGNPSDAAGQQIAKFIVSHGGGVMSRERLKLFLQILLKKHKGKTRLSSGQLDTLLDSFVEERSTAGDIEASEFVEWAWSA